VKTDRIHNMNGNAVKILPYIPIILEPVQVTPCQSPPQGSPPFPVHPGRVGDPNATYNPFMAETTQDKRNTKWQLAK
jgi:hypothetical protein